MDGMKLLALLAIAISLLSAVPADAAHHQRAHRETATHRALGGAGSNPAGSTTQHIAVPTPRERPAAAWTAPQATVAQQLVLVGMWRLQTDQFYRR